MGYFLNPNYSLLYICDIINLINNAFFNFMKYTISREGIELNYNLYKIKFPHNPSIKFSFIDNREIMGNLPKQTGLMMYSKEKKYDPWYGIILKIINNSGLGQVPGYIFGLDNIERFLIESKEKGYNVVDILEEVLLAKQKKIAFFGK